MSLLKTNKKEQLKLKKKSLKQKEQEIKEKLSGKNYSPIVAKGSRTILKKKNVSSRQKQQLGDSKTELNGIKKNDTLQPKFIDMKNKKNPLKRPIDVVNNDLSCMDKKIKVVLKEESSIPIKKKKIISEKTPLGLSNPKKQIRSKKNLVPIKNTGIREMKEKVVESKIDQESNQTMSLVSTKKLKKMLLQQGFKNVKTNKQKIVKPKQHCDIASNNTQNLIRLKPSSAEEKNLEESSVKTKKVSDGNTVRKSVSVKVKSLEKIKALPKRKSSGKEVMSEEPEDSQGRTPKGKIPVKKNSKVIVKTPISNVKSLKKKPSVKELKSEKPEESQGRTSKGNIPVRKNSKVIVMPPNSNVKTKKKPSVKELKSEKLEENQGRTSKGKIPVKKNLKVKVKPPISNVKNLRKRPSVKEVSSEQPEVKPEEQVKPITKTKVKNVTIVSLNASKIRPSLKARSLRRKGVKPERGVCVFKNIPHGFYEKELKNYCSQFGKVTGVYHPISKNGNSRGYAFVEFAHREVAEVVAETMDNYVMFLKRLRCEMVPKDSERPWVFNLKKTRQDIANEKREAGLKQRMRHLTKPEVATWVKRKRARISAIHKKLAAQGIDYQFKVNENLVKTSRGPGSSNNTNVK